MCILVKGKKEKEKEAHFNTRLATYESMRKIPYDGETDVQLQRVNGLDLTHSLLQKNL